MLRRKATSTDPHQQRVKLKWGELDPAGASHLAAGAASPVELDSSQPARSALTACRRTVPEAEI